MSTASALKTAFERRADGVSSSDGPLVGVFGAHTPDLPIAAHGAQVVDVKAPPLADATDGPRIGAVDAVTEPFMDPFTLRFLHRFAHGAFDRFALLVFARDDVSGLTACQYASELRRQGLVKGAAPRLHLWNLAHGAAPATMRFNLTEYRRLEAVLRETLGTAATRSDLEDALAAETARAVARARWRAGSPEAFVARAAGRWLPPGTHEKLLAATVPPPKTNGVPRIALVGTACDLPVMHDLCAGLGSVVADLQDYARDPALPVDVDPASILSALVSDPLHIRAMPPDRYTSALHDRTSEADLIIATTAPNDDSFGWEIPGLRETTQARGARFLDLGFRPFRPDADWYAQARDRIVEALG